MKPRVNDNSKEGRPVASSEANEVKDTEIISDQEIHSSPKRQRTDCESEWVCLVGMTLQVKEIIQGEKLTDKHMNASQKLLKRQFTLIEGLCTTLKVTYLQIFHTHGDH